MNTSKRSIYSNDLKLPMSKYPFNQKGDDFLDKIQIKDSYDDNRNITTQPKAQIEVQRKNNVILNLSKFIKTNNYHRKKIVPKENNKEYEDIIINLKKKISELLELNSKISNEKSEIEMENKELKRDIKKLKKYIIDNKIDEVEKLKKENLRLNEEIKIKNKENKEQKQQYEQLLKENTQLKSIEGTYSNYFKYQGTFGNDKRYSSSYKADSTEENTIQNLSHKTNNCKHNFYSIDPDNI